MHDDLDQRVRAALAAEAESSPLTLSEEMVAARLSRSSVPWLGLLYAATAAIVVLLALVVVGPRQLGTSVPAVTPQMSLRDAATDANSPSPTRQIIPLQDIRFDSWPEAQEYVSWPLREPTFLPSDFQLSAIQAFVIDKADMPADSISATFNGPGGVTITYWQTLVSRPGEFDFEKSIPDPSSSIPLERIEVDGSIGYWMGGVALSDDSGDFVGWDRGVTVLEWQSGDAVYRLEGMKTTLEDLLAVAGSLRPVE